MWCWYIWQLCSCLFVGDCPWTPGNGETGFSRNFTNRSCHSFGGVGIQSSSWARWKVLIFVIGLFQRHLHWYQVIIHLLQPSGADESIPCQSTTLAFGKECTAAGHPCFSYVFHSFAVASVFKNTSYYLDHKLCRFLLSMPNPEIPAGDMTADPQKIPLVERLCLYLMDAGRKDADVRMIFCIRHLGTIAHSFHSTRKRRHPY